MITGSQLAGFFRRPVQIYTVIAGALAFFVLLTWGVGDIRRTSFGPDYVPMVPSTAWAMLLLSCGVLAENQWPSKAVVRALAHLVALGVAVTGLVVWAQGAFGLQSPVEGWLMKSSGRVGGVPVGRMSPLTALLFLLAALAFWLESLPLSRRWLCRQAASVLALVTLAIGIVVILSYPAGSPVLYGTKTVPMALLSAVSFASLGLGLLTAAGADTFPLSLLQNESESASAPSRGRAVGGLLLTFLFLSTGIGTVGYCYFRHQITASRKATGNELSAIADLKVRQILDWRKERLGNAEQVMQQPFAARHVEQFLAGTAESECRTSLLTWLRSIREQSHGLRVLLLDPQMNVRLAIPEDKDYFGPTAQEFAREALHTNQVVLSDLHRSRFSGQIHLDLAIPVPAHRTPPGACPSPGHAGPQPIAVIDVEVDPCKFLYPTIQDWPTPSPTAEVLLVRRDGDDVVYLNELRHRKGTALSLKLPQNHPVEGQMNKYGGTSCVACHNTGSVSTSRKGSHDSLASPVLVATQAVRGREEVMTGVDYRNVPVLAVTRAVPGTPWFIVAKVDQAEIDAPLREQGLTTGALALVLIVAAALGVGLLGRRHNSQWLRRQLAIEREHRLILDSADEGILGLDAQGDHVFVNPAACRMLGYQPEELVGKSSHDVWHYREADGTPYPSQKCPVCAALKNGRTCHSDGEVFWRKDGTSFPVEYTATPSPKNDRSLALVLVFHEITARKRAEQMLRDSEARHRALFESSMDAVMTLAPPSWKFTSCNPATAKMFNVKDEATFTALGPWQLSPEVQPDGRPSAEKAKEMIETAMCGGSHLFEWTHKRLSGEDFHATVLLSRMELAGQAVLQATVRDITAQKLAEARIKLDEARANTLLELSQMTDHTADEIAKYAMENAVNLTGSTIGYIAFANDDETVLTMHYWSNSAMQQCAMIDKPIVYPVKDTGLWGEAIRQRKAVIANDYAASNPLKKGTPSGHVRLTRHMNIPVFDGGKIVAVAGVGNKAEDYQDDDVRQLTLFMDGMWRILCRKRAEESLKQSNQRLEAAIEQANEMAVRAECANRAKSTFLANMSHEIRTPMTSVLGYTDLLMNDSLSVADRKTYLTTVRRNGEHLLQLINDILDLSKIESGNMVMDFRPCQIASMIADVASMMRPRAEQGRSSLEVRYAGPLPETIHTDGARLQQAIVNLVGNAVKFTENGSIRIGVSFLPQWRSDQPAVSVEVTDTGIGIRPEALPRLFQPFAQAESSTTRKYGGSGLGLAISRQIVVALGGELTVQSAPGKGSTFTVTIPTGDLAGVNLLSSPGEAICENEAGTRWTPGADVLRGVNVLLVEDSIDNQLLLRTVLGDVGAMVDVVENGRLAIERAQAGTFDVVLMDMNMPEMDGYEATRRLRDRGFRRPILALTANAMSGDCEHSLAAGCDAHLVKPIDRKQLIETVARYSMPRTSRTDAATAGPSRPGSTGGNDGILSQFADDPQLARILPGFVERLSSQLDGLLAALEEERLEDVERLAHRISGVGGSYGYPTLSEAARSLELAAKAQDMGGAAVALAGVKEVCAAIQTGWAGHTEEDGRS